MLARQMLLVFAVACSSMSRPPESPTRLDRFDRFLSVTGGSRWDAVRVIEMRAAVSVGGLTGTLDSIEDVVTGRHRTQVHLGAFEIADGYDGRDVWELHAGGEVVVHDDREKLARSRTANWLLTRSYRKRDGAQVRELGTRSEGGRSYHALEVTPDGGSPIELWFDDAGLLARTIEKEGTDTVVTKLDDYRDVDGVKLPFRAIVDDGDPRNLATVTTTEAHARTVDPDPAAFARPRTDAERVSFVGGVRSTELPFELVNNHIYIRATIDGKPVRMLVDTGGLNMLTPAAATKLGLATSGKLAVGGAGEQKADLAFAKARELAVGDVRLDAPVFFVVDIGQLEDAEGEPFDGLVGFELMFRLAVRIDYPARKLQLSHRDDFRAPAGATAVAFELKDHMPIVNGELDGIAARFTIDTGARNSLTVTAPFARTHALEARYKPKFETVTGWGVGGPVRSKPVRFGTVKLGTVAIRDLAGDLYTGDKGAMADPDSAGNVGGGILRRFIVTFDYRGRVMYLEPTTQPIARDVYDRAGMFVIRDGSALRVVAVTPGGPAERAGIRADDRIVAVDGSARSVVEWRAIAVRTTGERHTVTIESGGKRVDRALVLAELLP